MDSDQQAPSYSHAMDRSIMQTDSSELTAAAALTSLVSGMRHNARSLPPAPIPNVNVHQAPCTLEADFEFPTQFTKSGRKKAVPFPVRLMKVLSLKQYEHIISWLPSGKSFKVHNSKVFTKEVLPLHFKSAKFSSFTRKLHRWGFMRNYRGQEEGAFFHDQFLRDRMDLASKMSCHSGPQDSPKSVSGKKIQQRVQQDLPVPPPPPARLPHSMQPRMPPSHIPDSATQHQSPGYMNHLYGAHDGYSQGIASAEYPNTPQQRQLVRPMGPRMPPPGRQSSIGHMSSPGATNFSPDLNVAIEMEVSRRLEEIMSVSANLEVMKEQAKMTAINRLQSYPSQQQQQRQMQPQMGQPQQQQQQQQQIPPPPPPPSTPQQQPVGQGQQKQQDPLSYEKSLMNPPMPSKAIPDPPQQPGQRSAVGAKTA